MSGSKHNHEKTRLLMRKRKCVHLLSNSPFMSRNAHNGGSGKKSPESWQKFNFNVKPQGSGAWYPWGIWLYFLSPWHENRVGFWLAAVDTPTMSNPPGYAQPPPPPYIYWCINEITRGAPCKVEKLTKMANLAWTANLAKILYGFGEYSIWMQNMAPWRLAIMTKMANGEDSENWTAMANPVKKHQRVERAILAKMAYLAKMANMANTHQSLSKNSNEMAKEPFERRGRFWQKKNENG